MSKQLLATLHSALQPPSARGRSENRLVLLGVIGGAVFLALVSTLVYVQRSLDRSQSQLAELAVPAEVHLAQLESALSAAFRRQLQVAATTDTAQLEKLRDRSDVEESLREAGQSSAVDAQSASMVAPELSAHVERFLLADTAYFGAVEKRHALYADFEKKLTGTTARIHALSETARALAGVLHLGQVLQLRAIVSSLDRGALRADLVRDSALGAHRGARRVARELVEDVMNLDERVADLDGCSLDQLNSLAANVLPQSRAQLDESFASLQESLADDPRLRATVDAMASQFHDLLPLIDGETADTSLISLRRRVLDEEARAADLRQATAAAAAQVAIDTKRLHSGVAAMIARTVGKAKLTQTTTRVFTLVVVLAGLIGCWLAARRIAQGIDELTAKNLSLTELKDSLTTLNASLDARVAERTKALSDANGLLKNEMVERQKIELELRLAQKLESLGRLAAGVAHEINTPVQFVSDSVHFIQDAMRDLVPLLGLYQEFESSATASGAVQQSEALAEQRERADLDYVLVHVPRALDRSLEGLSRVAEIVRSMKEFAHPDQTTMGMLDINKALETTLTVARGEYKLVAEVEKRLGDIPPISCYAGEINQVLLNIIVNAAHAIEDVVRNTDKKGVIRIETALDGESVSISISDTGGGIPASIRDQIFDPFFTTKAIGKGTGQGLAIARSVIQEKHGGSLTFDTAMGEGTTFTVRLPIAGKGDGVRPEATLRPGPDAAL